MKRVAPILPFIFLSLLTAIGSGWIRIGWGLPGNALAAQHGALMVNSFLASLIFLERAVTFKKGWWLLLPAVNAASILPFVFNRPLIAQWLLLIGGSGFAFLCSYFAYRYREMYYFVFLGGAFCLVGGDLIWLTTDDYPGAVTWWIVFLLLTIVAERLELSRFLPLSKSRCNWLLASLGLTMTSLFLPVRLNGQFVFATGVAATAVWLLRYDMARHSVRLSGQHRYSGLLLLTGYCWLVVMAFLLLFQNRLPFGYDAVLHSFFVGFVFSMIFSHAPIILPAITKMPVKIYRPYLYGWFLLLVLSLTLRLLGDCLGDTGWRKIGGMANGLTIFGFFLTVLVLFRSELKKRKTRLHKA